jgi:hypothetical protein
MSEAYVYQAAMICADCAEKVKDQLGVLGRVPIEPDNESTYDSDDYPKGPYPDGGGESDVPEHCDHCGMFLENLLTDEGADYVKGQVTGTLGGPGQDESWDEIATRADDLGHSDLATWIRFYFAWGQ